MPAPVPSAPPAAASPPPSASGSGSPPLRGGSRPPFPSRAARLAAAPGFLVPPLLGPAPSAGAAAAGGCRGSWSPWAGPGYVLASRVRPVILSGLATGGRLYGVPQSNGCTFPFRAVAGRVGFRARSFKFSAGLAGGQRRWLWVIWEGPARFGAPRRATVLAWLAGQFPGWAFS